MPFLYYFKRTKRKTYSDRKSSKAEFLFAERDALLVAGFEILLGTALLLVLRAAGRRTDATILARSLRQLEGDVVQGRALAVLQTSI